MVRDGRSWQARLAEAGNATFDNDGKLWAEHPLYFLAPAYCRVRQPDGDFEMLQWTTAGPGPRFGFIVHHDDAARERAYDRACSVGHLDKALDAAAAQGWVVVSMKNDWKPVFPPER